MDQEKLMNIIHDANTAYRTGVPTMSDAEYDLLLADLAEMIPEDAYEEFVESLMEEAGDVKLGDYVIGSLKKIKYENQELLVKLAQLQILDWVFSSAKIDGCSFVAKYKFIGNGFARYTSCSSRGDGAAGTDWTEQGRFILPQQIRSDRDVDVRGEFTLTDNSHKELGYKNRRNGTVGIMMSDTIEPEKLRHVKAYAYQILNPKVGRELIRDQFADLERLGFAVASYMAYRIEGNLEERLKEDYLIWKDALPYDIDGLVLSSPQWTNENNKFFPVGKIAYKVNSEGVPVKWKDIRWTLTKGRLYYPTYMVTPTEIDGVTVSKATANNTRMLMAMNLCENDELLLIRSGCVIPKVIGINKVGGAPYQFPTHCPECNSELGWNKVLDKNKQLVDGAHLMCPNVKCGEVKRVESFVKALEIENVSEKRLREFGILTFEDLLNFRPDASSKLQGAFYKDLESKLFNQPRHMILRAMKFDGFGTSLFDSLYNHFNCDLNSMNNLFVQCTHLGYLDATVLPAGIGPRTIEKAAEDWHTNNKLLNAIIFDPRYKEPAPVEKKPAGEAKLTGNFLFTGSFSTFPRKELEKMVPVNGGKLASSVSKNLDYLVVGEGGGSKQDKAEKISSIKIIDEATFLAMLA